jgi:hypothetical protein
LRVASGIPTDKAMPLLKELGLKTPLILPKPMLDSQPPFVGIGSAFDSTTVKYELKLKQVL